MINLFKQKYQPKEQPRDPNEKPVIDTGLPYGGEHIPFFSVCIPTYNRAQMLPVAIESVLEQDFDDFELIICDNASTDNTEEVVRGYGDRRLRYVRYENLVSMYANHNRCIELARSDWLVFLHSDDGLEFNALYNYRQITTAQKGIAVFYPAAQLHKSVRWAKDRTIKCYSIQHPYQLYRYPAGTPSGAVYRLSLLKSYRFEENTICADLDLLLNISKGSSPILILGEEFVKIGTQKNRSTTTWQLSGNFVRDVSSCLCFHLTDEIFAEIIQSICGWSPTEIARLMLFLTYQGRLSQVKKLEMALGNAKDYQLTYDYRHVIASKLFGYHLYKSIYLFKKQLSWGSFRQGII